MTVQNDRDIIRLWNQLRRLQREGRPTAALQRQIKRALAARDEAEAA